MADAKTIAAPHPAHVPPMAKPGYGKRGAPGQPAPRREDFAHLRPREAQIATFIDRLPEGAAMDAKTLAAHLPAYGQAACRTALRHLSEAGHLRRVKERLQSADGTWQWVTRTYFSRAPRGDAWWERVLSGDAPPAPAGRPARSRAYALLATLGRTDPRMTLSDADCAALEPLASEWLERGADEAEVVRALTAGLPPQVHHAAALARRRLTGKLPPHREPAPIRTPLRIAECTVCAAPGRPEALPGGLCRDCRGEPRPPAPAALSPEEVRARAALLRAINREPERNHA
ncbi:hypothetical protein AB0K09_06505 [Streptomyces sp. NPDC049577]|uniref:hypothetical protein n=1 Tax=Streptomyces sp. NPDC049577 TaxID=3155153 RepID=UPI0034351794